MGSILNIRVIAQTLDEEEVAKVWPALCALVWPEWSSRLGLWPLRPGKQPSHVAESALAEKQPGPAEGTSPVSSSAPSSAPAPVPAISPVEKALGKRKHGVVELAEGFGDLLRLGLALGNVPELPARVAEALREPGEKIAAALKGLNAALADWKPGEANALSNALELALDQAERVLVNVLHKS